MPGSPRPLDRSCMSLINLVPRTLGLTGVGPAGYQGEMEDCPVPGLLGHLLSNRPSLGLLVVVSCWVLPGLGVLEHLCS